VVARGALSLFSVAILSAFVVYAVVARARKYLHLKLAQDAINLGVRHLFCARTIVDNEASFCDMLVAKLVIVFGKAEEIELFSSP
jgi:hypothetical protein